MNTAPATVRLIPTFLTLCLLTLCGIAPGVARAQHDHEEHAQHAAAGGDAAVAQLQLDGEAKWATDDSLREGMAQIRKAFDADHPAIHAGRETDAAYDALATRVETEVNGIVAKCKLPPAADENLHYVVADLLRGAGLMRGSDATQTRHDGAALVHGALLAYGKFFDDPTWTSVATPAGG